MSHLPSFPGSSSHRPSRARLQSWRAFRKKSPHPIFVPLLFIDWCCQRLAFFLSRWSLLAVLDYLGTFSILFAVILYFTEAGQRREQKHYQAWQVVNTAQGKGGNGGRIEALQELNADHVALIGVNGDGAFLFNIMLENAHLRRASFHNTDLREAHFARAGLQQVNLTSANLRDADLHQADLSESDLTDADLTDANLTAARAAGITLDNADLTGANIADLADWQSIQSIKQANIHALKNAPDGFVKWAMQHGAVNIAPAAASSPASSPPK